MSIGNLAYIPIDFQVIWYNLFMITDSHLNKKCADVCLLTI